MSQFIGYHIDGDSSVPVATGITHDDAQAKTIRRILGMGLTFGEMGVQERPDVSVEDFTKLTEVTENFAKEKGLV